MNLTSLSTIRELLAKHGASPKKSLGQNFLVNKGLAEKVVRAAELSPQDAVVEVGPGIGALTKALAQQAGRVLAVEKDRRLIPILRETLADVPRVEIIHGDILHMELSGIGRYKLVANLPYYITSPVIRKFLEAKRQPEAMVLMVQKEVARRLTARPPDMNLLALSVQFYGVPKLLGYAKRGSFWPEPDVDSAIVKITPRKRRDGAPSAFFSLAKAGFSHPRRQLAGTLAPFLQESKEETAEWLQKNGVSPSARAETLSLEQWVQLAKSKRTR